MSYLKFINTAINTLSVDPIIANYPRKISATYTLVKPTPVVAPKLVCYSKDALDLLDINLAKKLDSNEKEDLVEYFSGNKIFTGSQPAAHCYYGYQFGIFAGQLGDGRAHYLGEIINQKGECHELQLKGSGFTPFSRKGDGRAVLRSSIREFLCSEAMFHLGIPTTRSATIITSDTYVERDINYNGNIIREKATIISRIAPSFLRFGSLQIGDFDDLSDGSRTATVKQLLDYIIKHHYSDIEKQYNAFEDKIVAFMEQLVFKTAKLVALWQAYGFVHGVLNTDNMSVVGITIDYGPFSFMERFDPNFTSNTSDTNERYSFTNQPSICKWNLGKLVQSISLHFPNIQQKLQNVLNNYCHYYDEIFSNQIKLKFGLFKKLSEDNQLIQLFFESLYKTQGDYTNIFRLLSKINADTDINSILNDIIMQTTGDIENHKNIWTNWLRQYQKRLLAETESYSHDSCVFTLKSSLLEAEQRDERVRIMNSVNPKFILRNGIIQTAIEKAEEGDYSGVHELLELIKDPYDNMDKYSIFNYDKITTTRKISLSCSS